MTTQIELKTDGLQDIKKLHNIFVSQDIAATATKGYRKVNTKSLLGLLSLNPDEGFSLELRSDEDLLRIKKVLRDFVMEECYVSKRY